MFQQLNSTFRGDMPPLNYNDKIVMMQYVALNGNDTVITSQWQKAMKLLI